MNEILFELNGVLMVLTRVDEKYRTPQSYATTEDLAAAGYLHASEPAHRARFVTWFHLLSLEQRKEVWWECEAQTADEVREVLTAAQADLVDCYRDKKREVEQQLASALDDVRQLVAKVNDLEAELGKSRGSRTTWSMQEVHALIAMRDAAETANAELKRQLEKLQTRQANRSTVREALDKFLDPPIPEQLQVVRDFAAERARQIPEEIGEHTCILTQTTSDGSVPPPCKACVTQGLGFAYSAREKPPDPAQKTAFAVGSYVKLRHQVDSARWKITAVRSSPNDIYREHRLASNRWWPESKLEPCEPPTIDPEPTGLRIHPGNAELYQADMALADGDHHDALANLVKYLRRKEEG